jgi:phage terminase large subunit-like protein
MKELKGAVIPRIHTPLIEGQSKVTEIEELANRIGLPLLDWQRWVLDDMMKVDKDGKFKRTTVGLLIARQNGKTHVARMRILWGLINGERILAMSSNRAMALDTFRQVVDVILDHDWLVEMLKEKPRFANGQERIVFKNGGRYELTADNRSGSRGKTVDFLYIDELREISVEGWKAARPTTRATGGVTFTTSNAGDAFSEVLNDLRENALSYPTQSFAWYEYSAPQHCKISDRKAWAMANPSLGHLITEETLEESVATNSVESTRTELLCQWVSSLESPWSYGTIEKTTDTNLKLLPQSGATVMAFDVSPSKRSAALVAGIVQEDGKIGVGVMDTWSSEVAVDELQLAREIHAWVLKYRPRLVLFDKYATATIADRLEKSGVMVGELSGQKFYQACSDLKDALDNGRLVHSGQDEWVAQMNNVAMKTNDAGWRIIRRKSAGEVQAAISTAMVVHELTKPQSTPKIYSGE